MAEIESRALRFPFAGYLTLVRRAEDGTDSTAPEDIYTSGRNIYGAVTKSYSITTEELPDENSKYPAAIYDTGATSSLSVIFRTEDPDLDMFVKGSSKVVETNASQLVPNITFTIGQDGKVKITDPDGNDAKINENGIILVRDFMTGSDYTEASGATPSAGEYSVDPTTGEFTFDTTDAGKKVHITCEYIVGDAISYVDSAQPKSQTMKAILSYPAEDYSATNPMWVNEIYDAVQLSGDYAPLAQQKATTEKTLSLQTTRPRGNEAVKKTFSKAPIDTTKDN